MCLNKCLNQQVHRYHSTAIVLYLYNTEQNVTIRCLNWQTVPFVSAELHNVSACSSTTHQMPCADGPREAITHSYPTCLSRISVCQTDKPFEHSNNGQIPCSFVLHNLTRRVKLPLWVNANVFRDGKRAERESSNMSCAALYVGIGLL